MFDGIFCPPNRPGRLLVKLFPKLRAAGIAVIPHIGSTFDCITVCISNPKLGCTVTWLVFDLQIWAFQAKSAECGVTNPGLEDCALYVQERCVLKC